MVAEPALIVFDTGFLFAFFNKTDSHHQDAVVAMGRIVDGEWGQPVLNDLVLAELFNLLRARKMPPGLERAALQALTGATPLLGPLRSSPAPTGHGAATALDLFKKHRQLSFTDAALLDVVRRHPSSRLATFDSGFKGLCDVVP